MAAADPFYAVASDRTRRKGDAQAWTRAEFLAKGETVYHLLRPLLAEGTGWGTVIDVGCGAGRMARQLATMYERVVGVDVAPAMLELAASLNRDRPNLDFRLGAGDRLPVEDASADLVFSFQVLQHIDPVVLPGLIADMYRALRPGGSVLLHVPAPSWGSFVRSVVYLGTLRHWLTHLALRWYPALDVSRRPWVPGQYHTYSPSRMAELFEAAGFINIRMKTFRPGVPSTAVYLAVRPGALP